MKAIAVTPSEERIAVIDRSEPPPPGPDQVRFRVLEAGICGTDKEIATFEYGTPPEGENTLVIGHECLGEVESVGEAVETFSPGDLVVPTVRRPCPDPDCVPCRAGQQDFCSTGRFTECGIKEAHGFMSEWVVDRADALVPVPDTLRPVAVLTEPLSIAEKAMRQIHDVQDRLPWPAPRHLNAVVLGAGPIGLLGAMALVRRNFQTVVYSLEPDDHPKAQLVRDIGGRYVSAKDHTLDDLNRDVRPIDVVYEAAGVPSVAFTLLEHLDRNGVFVFTGVPGAREPSELNMAGLMRNLVLKNQAVFGTVNAGRNAYLDALEDLDAFQAAWPGALDRLITGRFPPSEIHRLLSWDAPGIKNVIRWTPPGA